MLTTIPSNIRTLSKLKVLEAYNNVLNELPSTIDDLTSLLELRIQNNLLQSLPLELCAIIPQITHFNVACNQLNIDAEIDRCAALDGKLDDQGDHQTCTGE